MHVAGKLKLVLTLLLLGTTLLTSADGEDKAPRIKALFGEPTGNDPFGSLNLTGSDPFALPGAQFETSIVPKDAIAGEEVTLQVTIKVPPGSHTYSMDPSFSGRTQIKLNELKGLEEIADAEWEADHKPTKLVPEGLNQEVEEFTRDVTFSRKFRALSDVDQASVSGVLDYQICNTSCTPYEEKFSADVKLKPRQFPLQVEEEREFNEGEPSPAKLTVRMFPESAKPGDEVTLEVTLDMAAGWHTFALSHPADLGGDPTAISLSRFQGLKAKETGFRDQQTFKVEKVEIPNRKKPIVQHLYEDKVTWTQRFEVLEGAESFGLSGTVDYQVCREGLCLPLETVEFRLGDLRSDAPISAMEVPRISVAELENELVLDEEELSLGMSLVYAFLGGLILNVMPCVLPVLAIKILSFVKQAGESRGRILELNLAYSAGVISVFLCLATLAATVQLGWGGLFQYAEFNIFMACLVFAMGLSLLGVFEIPVPGLGGGGGQREGLLGAFLTGIFATFLATPCSGPFMGLLLGWSVKQSTFVIYLVWGMMGLGMSFPYLLTGIFPQALKLLPKPGPWMVRFKEFSGFALMAAVIWIISNFSTELIVPVLIMLMGIAFGLWMIGNLYDITSAPKHKNVVRVFALLATCGIAGYGLMQIPSFQAWVRGSDRLLASHERDASDATGKPMSPPATRGNVGETQTTEYRPTAAEHELPWIPFSEEALMTALNNKQTVLIDFTADWCLICKDNEAKSLNTKQTLDVVQKNNIVTLYADYTSKNDFIKGWLKKFNSISVPLTVIFPGNNPKKPLLLRDKYSESDLHEKLKAAIESMETAQVGDSTN